MRYGHRGVRYEASGTRSISLIFKCRQQSRSPHAAHFRAGLFAIVFVTTGGHKVWGWTERPCSSHTQHVLEPPLDTDSLSLAGVSFDTIASDYDSTFSQSWLGRDLRTRVQRRLLETFSPPATLLELNCGTGEDCLFLARNGFQVVATDVSGKMLEVSARKAAGHLDRIRFQRLDLNLPRQLKGGPFDGAFSNFGGLNCVPDLDPIVRFLAEKVRPGGSLLLVFSESSLPLGMDLLPRKGKAPACFSTPLRSHHSLCGRAGAQDLVPDGESDSEGFQSCLSFPSFQWIGSLPSAHLCRQQPGRQSPPQKSLAPGRRSDRLKIPFPDVGRPLHGRVPTEADSPNRSIVSAIVLLNSISAEVDRVFTVAADRLEQSECPLAQPSGEQPIGPNAVAFPRRIAVAIARLQGFPYNSFQDEAGATYDVYIRDDFRQTGRSPTFPGGDRRSD